MATLAMYWVNQMILFSTICILLSIIGGSAAEKQDEKRMLDPIGSSLFKRQVGDKRMLDRVGSSLLRKRMLDRIGSSMFKRDEEHAEKRMLDRVGSSLLKKRMLDPIGSSLFKKRMLDPIGRSLLKRGDDRRTIDAIADDLLRREAVKEEAREIKELSDSMIRSRG